MARRPVLVVSNEFFIVPGTNSFAVGGSFTQNRFQVGVRLLITDLFHSALLRIAVSESA
jgi:hypothetical protein